MHVYAFLRGIDLSTYSWPNINPKQMPGLKSWAIYTTPKSMDLSNVMRNIHQYCIFPSTPFTVHEELLFEISVHTMGKYANPLAVLTSTCDCMAYVRIWGSRVAGMKGRGKKNEKDSFLSPPSGRLISYRLCVRRRMIKE